jgi:hypothetical protein
MFKVQIQKNIGINEVDEAHLIDTLMHFSFLTGYKASGGNAAKKELTLTGGTVMSLNPNSLKHSIIVDHDKDGCLTIKLTAMAFPWEKSKVKRILSHRLSQLINHLYSEGIILEDSVNEEEKEAPVVLSPFTHLSSGRLFSYVTAFLKVLFSMLLCVIGVIFTMWIYGILVIAIRDSRLFLEVTFGTISKKDLIGGGSVIGIAIGYAVGALLSVYFALSEIFEFLNKRILSFAVFYALILCFFIIEEEAFIVTSFIAVCVPFIAYTFYHFIFGLKKVYLKNGR